MKIIVAGSRELTDYNFLENKLLGIISREQYEREIPNKDLEIVSGGARGADSLAEKFCEKWLKRKANVFPAKWNDLETQPVYLKKNTYGQWTNLLAGEIRNKAMGNYVIENGGGICIGFILGVSKGTKNMLSIAKKLGIKTYKIDYDKENPHEQQIFNTTSMLE